MKFLDAVDQYIADQRAYGRINSARTEQAYRQCLEAHAEDVNGRDPRKTGRGDVKRTLGRWPKPNTRNTRHAILRSFYRWTLEEGLRKDNPADQVRRAKPVQPQVYRMTRGEALALLQVSRRSPRETRIAHLGLCAGVRNQELRGLQGRHFTRAGFVWVSADIAKGARERWVPVVGELEPVAEEIAASVGHGEYVICARRRADPPHNTRWRELPRTPTSAQSVWRTVSDLGRDAGIAAHIHPHTLRHAFGDHVAKYAGLRAAQEMLGHAGVDTTASTYVDRPTLDELQISVHGFSYGGLPPHERALTARKATTGIEPVDSPSGTDRGPQSAPEGARRR